MKIIDNKVENDSDTDIEELLDIIKGPDFPTGAMILGKREELMKLTGRVAAKLKSVR